MAWRQSFRLNRKACGRGCSPGGAVAQRLRGYGWRSEKSVKAIAPTGAALAFLCFDFFFRIVKGVQPLTTGCGTQHPLRALGGTRVLLAAAPTTAPCFRHWRRLQLLRCGVGGVQRQGGGSRNTPPCLWPSGASMRACGKQELSPQRRRFRRKQALQIPFTFTTPPVKMDCRSVRRRSGSPK